MYRRFKAFAAKLSFTNIPKIILLAVLLCCAGNPAYADNIFVHPDVYTVGGTLSSVALGDFNADGRQDIVVSGGTAISVLFNKGDGTFLSPVAYSIGGAAGSVAVGDFDRDGRADIVVAIGHNAVGVLINRGDGTFGPPTTHTVGYGVASVAVGDLNGDGAADVVSANHDDQTITVLLNSGGNFSSSATYRLYPFVPKAVAVGDLNGDGKPEILTANMNRGCISVLTNNGDGTFTNSYQVTTKGNPTAVAVGDLNGDGRLDVITASSIDSEIDILFGNGDGTLENTVSTTEGDTPKSVVATDFNGDGKIDFLTINQAYTTGSRVSTASVNINKGNGTFYPVVTYDLAPVSNAPVAGVAGDLNGDGKPDIATIHTDGTVKVLLNGGDGTFDANVIYSGSHDAVSVGDLNGDGKSDIVTGDAVLPNVDIRLNNGDGTFAYPISYPSGRGTLNLPKLSAITDGNADGKADIYMFYSYVRQSMSMLTNKGDGTLSPPVSYETRVGPAVAVADFDSDGRSDYVTSGIYVAPDYKVSYGVYVLWNKSSNPFGISTFHITGPASVNNLATADFDGDGRIDIVAQNSDATITLLLNDGSGGFASAVVSSIGTTTSSPMAVADFNRDGRPDIVMANAKSSTVGVFMNNGNGTFASAATCAVGNDPESVAVGDFNNDGSADIVTANRSSSSITLLLNKGDGTFLPAMSYPMETFTNVVVSGDLNGNGRTGLVVGNDMFSSFTVLHAADTTPDTFSFSPKTNVAPSTEVVSEPVTVSGINVLIPISISTGQYSINNGPFTTTPQHIFNGSTVRVKLTSAAGGSTSTSATLTIGGVSAPFKVTTAIGPPGPPTGVTATAGAASATVTFTAPASGSPITSYTVTSTPGNVTASGPTSPITVGGLTDGTPYTFTVTATSAAGTGPASAPSNVVVPMPAAVPGPPTGVTAKARSGQATVSFVAPSLDGGSRITRYTVTSHPGGLTATGTTSPITVSKLANGTDYVFTVTATNAVGTGPESTPSNTVTPEADLMPILKILLLD